MRLRNFCFTSYDTSSEFKDRIKNMAVKYIVYGNETCPETSKLHLQGYCELEKQSTLSAVKNKLFMSKQLHVEPRRGTAKQAADYCKKEGDWVEFGTISRPGTRTDITDIKEAIQDGATFKEIVDETESYQALRIAEKILVYYEAPRQWKSDVYWYHGTTGTGKSRHAFSLCRDPWVSSGDLKWFQGYDGHEDVIFDDFRSNCCSFSTLLRLTDRYPYQVECKGASRQFKPKRIFITSSQSPQELYSYLPQSEIDQLLRRIKEIKMFTLSIQFQNALQEEINQTSTTPPNTQDDDLS